MTDRSSFTGIKKDVRFRNVKARRVSARLITARNIVANKLSVRELVVLPPRYWHLSISVDTQIDTLPPGALLALRDIVFDEDIANPSSAYNTSTGLFTAPINGVYVFNVEVAYKSLEPPSSCPATVGKRIATEVLVVNPVPPSGSLQKGVERNLTIPHEHVYDEVFSVSLPLMKDQVVILTTMYDHPNGISVNKENAYVGGSSVGGPRTIRSNMRITRL